jgi:hypothetical protein
MTHETRSAPPAEPGGGGYEKSDLSVKAIATFGVVLTAVLIAALVSMAWLFDFFDFTQARRDVPRSPLASARSGPQEPRLQVNPIQDLKTFREAEERVLMNYGWVNKEAGVARIPIQRAMELVVERGLSAPVKTPAKDRTPGGPR